jgi:hypothetical protein
MFRILAVLFVILVVSVVLTPFAGMVAAIILIPLLMVTELIAIFFKGIVFLFKR